MALVMSPWFGRGCGRRARPFSLGRPSLFTDLVIVKVPMMQRQASCAPSMSNARVVQWAETPEAHTFKLRLPGLKKEDLQIQVQEDRTLYINYSHQPKETAKNDDDSAKEGEAAATATDAQSEEQKHTSFMRKFKLPETADLEQIKAEVTNETLTVTVPKLKMKASEPRRIEISDGAGAASEDLVKAAETSDQQADAQPSISNA